MAEQIELAIDELLLDEDNPRLGSVNSQSAALEAIINLNELHFQNMMLSIKKNGLDPGDSFYVIEASEGDFIVLEGNRRQAAILVLMNPSLLNGVNVDKRLKSSLIRASQDFLPTMVEPIRCVLFENRDIANEWIFRRHTGNLIGEGRVNWGTLEQQRFEGDRSVLDIIDFVGRNADFSEKEWEATKTVIQSRKSTNLSRLLDSATGRKHLGITNIKDDYQKIPMLEKDPEWALRVLEKIFQDVRDGVVDSRDINNATDISNYFQNLPKELQPDGQDQKIALPFKDIYIKKRPTKNISQPKMPTKSAPKERVTLAPKKHPFNTPNSTKGQTLLRESSQLDASKFSICAAFVLRGFVELSINDYMELNKVPTSEKNAKGNVVELDLSAKAERVVQHIVSSKKFKSADLRGFRNNIMTKTSPTSIQSLNGFVHNKFQIPTGDTLRSGWDSAVPVFIATYGTP